jgi:hypothetical protein
MITYLPLIASAEDHKSIRDTMGRHMPYTYDEWAQITRDSSDQLIKAVKRAVLVEVEPDDFAAWIAATGREPTLDALSAFAFLVGEREDRE